LRAHEDKSYSLCDAMSLVVMERMKITDAIAFDRHFAEYGRFALI
jgi:predicted nucleic acid-binding protein